MSKFIGRRVHVGWGVESSRGVAVAAAHTVPKMNFSLDDKANKARSTESFGNISGNADQAIVTGRFSEGAFEGDINVNSFGDLLETLFGTDTTTTVYTSAYKHTYSILNSNFMSNGGGFTPGLNQPVSVVPISCDAMTFSLCLLPNPAVHQTRRNQRSGDLWRWQALRCEQVGRPAYRRLEVPRRLLVITLLEFRSDEFPAHLQAHVSLATDPGERR